MEQAVVSRARGAGRHPGQTAPAVDRSPVGVVARALPAHFGAVREARDVVRAVLVGWRTDAICDDVALVASELVANALRHGLRVALPASPSAARTSSRAAGTTAGTAACMAAGTAKDGPIRISLIVTGSHVICEVTDPSDHPPVLRQQEPLSDSGNGLTLVESLSQCWGWTALGANPQDPSSSVEQGKAVWAIFSLPAPVALSWARPEAAVGAA